MNDERFVMALAGVFGAITVLLVLVGMLVSPVAIGVALPFGAGTYLLWYHASGRLRERVRREARARRRPGGAARGPDPAGSRAAREARASGTYRTARSRADGRTGGDPGPTRREALGVLGLGSDATQSEIRRAYRERVKEVHPDRGGDRAAFQRVTRAYRRLREDSEA